MLGKRVILECDAKFGSCDVKFTGIETSEFAPRAKAIALTRYRAATDGWLFIPALISSDGKNKDICNACSRNGNQLQKFLISDTDAR